MLRDIAHKLDPLRHQRRTSAASSRHAARQRAGIATCTVEYNAEVLDTLIALHWASEQKASDRGAVGQAISAARCKSGMPSDVYGARGVFIGMKLDITMR